MMYDVAAVYCGKNKNAQDKDHYTHIIFMFILLVCEWNIVNKICVVCMCGVHRNSLDINIANNNNVLFLNMIDKTHHFLLHIKALPDWCKWVWDRGPHLHANSFWNKHKNCALVCAKWRNLYYSVNFGIRTKKTARSIANIPFHIVLIMLGNWQHNTPPFLQALFQMIPTCLLNKICIS